MSKKVVANKLHISHFVMKRLTEGGFILACTMALFVFLSLLTYRGGDVGMGVHIFTQTMNSGGQVGAYIASFLYLVFGYCAYVLPLCFVYLFAMILKDYRVVSVTNKSLLLIRSLGFVLLLLGGCGFLSMSMAKVPVLVHGAGGIIGHYIALGLEYAVNRQGAVLLLSASVLVGITWLTGMSWMHFIEWIGHGTCLVASIVARTIYAVLRGVAHVCLLLVRRMQLLCRSIANYKVADKQPVVIYPPKVPKVVRPVNVHAAEVAEPVTARDIAREKLKDLFPKPEPLIIEKQAEARVVPTAPVLQGLPPLTLLSSGSAGLPMGGYSHQELENLSRDVEQHLLDFGVQADVVCVHPGPVVTRFELQLAAGIKVSKLTALAKDLARSLSVLSVRVVEIIPGKTVVGIELPNPTRATVCLSDVLSAEVYQQAHSPLTLALGVDIAGHPMVVDLAKMPHLLVAGTTGSGKSVGINAMILSVLFKATPEQVRLILIDPKMLELSVYDGIPHLLTPVVTDMKEAASALRWCVAEMEQRYRLMSAFGVRNLLGFNSKIVEAAAKGEHFTDPLWKSKYSVDDVAPTLQPLPYIVVVIDELADMMMVVGKKVEQLIARIAQKARAAGIHLILATQRPSVDVLTGLIKSNIPTRISFQVSSKIDSRTILDQQGAEQLLGHGDMLFLAPGTGAPLRVHGAFVDDKEVHRIADDWRARGQPDYIEDITRLGIDNIDGGSDDESDVEESDVLYDQAVEFVLESRKASISAVQRRLKVGYNRAARLVEEMERKGILGPLEGGMRDVLVPQLEKE